MNSQEREQLARFLGQLTEVRLTDRDAEAADMIREAVARQPDASYLLVQRAMLVEQALHAAKARIDELQHAQRAAPAAGEAGFLGGRNPWAPPVAPASAPSEVPGAAAYRMPSGAMSPGAALSAGGLGGSFLGNVATTAAGVVAGSFLFQGLESLLGHHQAGGSLWTDSGAEHLAEQTVINNYYGTGAETAADSGIASNGGAFLASEVDEGYPDDAADDGDWI